MIKGVLAGNIASHIVKNNQTPVAFSKSTNSGIVSSFSRGFSSGIKYNNKVNTENYNVKIPSTKNIKKVDRNQINVMTKKEISMQLNNNRRLVAENLKKLDIENRKLDIEYNEIISHPAKAGYYTVPEYSKKQQTRMKEIQKKKQAISQSAHQIKNVYKALPYEYLKYSSEYQSFDVKPSKITKDNLKKYQRTSGASKLPIDFISYSKENKGVSPLALNKYLHKNKIDVLIAGTDNEILDTLREASIKNPELEKAYEYIYATKGLDASEKYLKDMEDVINQTAGMKRAEDKAAKLSSGGNQNWASDHLKLSYMGLTQGAKEAGTGLLHWLKGKDVYSASEYEQIFFKQHLEKRGSGTMTYEIAESLGNMLPSVTISLIPGMQPLGTFMLGASSGGNSYHQTLVEGYDHLTAALYGATSGASEAMFEKTLGAIPGIGSGKPVVNNFRTLVGSALKETGEEMTQTVFQQFFLDPLALNKNVDKDWYKDVMKSGLYGFITAGIMQTPVGINNMYSIDQSIDQYNSYIDVMKTDSYQSYLNDIISGRKVNNPYYSNMTENFITTKTYLSQFGNLENKVDLNFDPFGFNPQNKLPPIPSINNENKLPPIPTINNENKLPPIPTINSENKLPPIPTVSNKVNLPLSILAESNKNSNNLKNEVLSTINENDEPLKKARLAYLNLNRRLHYDMNYIKGINTSKIYNEIKTFDNLKNNNVICKGWSELYRETLLNIGFKPENVKIMGKNGTGNHKWIEVNLNNGMIIIADATESIGDNQPDLTNSKFGTNTMGFMLVPEKYSGKRLNKWIDIKDDDFMFWQQRNKNLFPYIDYHYDFDGFNPPTSFLKKLSNNNFFRNIYSQSQDKVVDFVFNQKIPHNMDAVDVKNYYTLYMLRKFDDKYKRMFNLQRGEFHYQDGIEPVFVISTNNDKYMLYSESTGKIIFNNKLDYLNYINSKNVNLKDINLD